MVPQTQAPGDRPTATGVQRIDEARQRYRSCWFCLDLDSEHDGVP